MPTIIFASPKGGVGKTTSSLVLATQLARVAQVTVIDADPNHPIAAWAKSPKRPANLFVISDATEEDIIERIEEAAALTPFVIVDLEGTASKIVLLAVSQADLVIVPMQGSALDASQAARALKLIKQQEKMSGRAVLNRVLLTRTNPKIQPRTTRLLRSNLVDAGVGVLQTELNERDAYRSMFSYSLPLHELPGDVPNVPKAIANAAAFSAEVIEILRLAAKSEAVA